MASSVSKKFHSKKLHKAREVLKSARSKFEHKIEKHRRINRGYLYTKNATRNLTFRIITHASKLLGRKFTNNNINSQPPYGDELLQQTQTLTRNEFRDIYDGINFKSGVDLSNVRQPTLAQSIQHGKRIFAFANDNESIPLDGLAGRVVRNKSSSITSNKRSYKLQNDMKEVSAAAKYLIDILECNKNNSQDNSPKNVLDKNEEGKSTDENEEEESIIILTDDITASNDEDDDSIENEDDSVYSQDVDSSEDDIIALSNDISGQSHEEIELSSEGEEVNSDHIEKEVGDSDSDCVSETSILRKEESFMVNDIENEIHMSEKESDVCSFDFPHGEHIGNYKKPDVIDLSKYETYVNDYTF